MMRRAYVMGILCSAAILAAASSHAQRRQLVPDLPSVEVNLEVLRALRTVPKLPPRTIVGRSAPVPGAVQQPFARRPAPPVPSASAQVVTRKTPKNQPRSVAAAVIPKPVERKKVAKVKDPVVPPPVAARAPDTPVVPESKNTPNNIVSPENLAAVPPVTDTEDADFLKALLDQETSASETSPAVESTDTTPPVAQNKTQETAQDVLDTLMDMPKAVPQDPVEIVLPDVPTQPVAEVVDRSAPALPVPPAPIVTPPAPVIKEEPKAVAVVEQAPEAAPAEVSAQTVEIPEIMLPDVIEDERALDILAIENVVDEPKVEPLEVPALPDVPVQEPQVEIVAEPTPLPDLPALPEFETSARSQQPAIKKADTLPPMPDLPPLPQATNAPDTLVLVTPPVTAATPPEAMDNVPDTVPDLPDLPPLAVLTGDVLPAPVAPALPEAPLNEPPATSIIADIPQNVPSPPMPEGLPPLSALTGEKKAPQVVVESAPVAAPVPTPAPIVNEDMLPDLPPLEPIESNINAAVNEVVPPALPATSGSFPPIDLPQEQTVAALPPEPVTAAQEALTVAAESLTIEFSGDSRNISAADEQKLKALASALNRHNKAIRVVGYGSGVPEQRSQARRIALARTLAVRAILIENGVTDRRIKPDFEQVEGDSAKANRVEVLVR